MPYIDESSLEIVLSFLKFIGIGSFFSVLAFFIAWISFFPELTIDTVVDKSKKFNSESRIKIKNLGKLPALEVSGKLSNLCFKLEDIKMEGSEVNNMPIFISRLSSGEVAEIPILQGVSVEGGAHFSEYTYQFEIVYKAKLFFIPIRRKKRWDIWVRNFGEEFSWNSKIL